MYNLKRALHILLILPMVFSSCTQSNHENASGDIKFRRVVTGHTNDGKSVVVSDNVAETKFNKSGFVYHKIWGADSIHTFPNDGSLDLDENFSWFPPTRGYRFVHFTLPPNDTLTHEDIAKSNSGMHKSNTIDLLYIISGKCMHKMGDGSMVELNAGDVLIQNGTLHAWFNPFKELCSVVGVLIGAHRSG